MTKPDPMLFALQGLVTDLSLINRRHMLPGLERYENDIVHSFNVPYSAGISAAAIPLGLI